ASDTKRMNPDLLIRTVLGTFLFRDNAVFKKVAVLSGGEKSRLALAKLLLDPPNLLLLDEPTTHLDMASVEALVEALKSFEGTVAFISHDLYFVNALANHVAHVENGRVRLYNGNHDDFLRLRPVAESADGAPSPAPARAGDGTPAAGPGWMKSSDDDIRRMREADKARGKRRKKLNQRLRELEEQVADLKSEIGSVFIQSDYKKLMEIDGALKAAEKELADTRDALAQDR
nr:ATP-binding cassette domain-containing protein [Elusimicrobiota bacterium]